MGTTTALWQLLMTLCRDSPWKYAVFWKLEHGNQMQLTWEDGYCDYPNSREAMGSVSDDIFSNGMNEYCDTSINDGSCGGYPIGLAVSDMSCLQYALGEGVIGKVAYTGNHCWFFSDNILASELNSNSVPKCPDEWLLQFAAGIKTILLVPVVPHGVLQLGSLEMVAEDLALVAYIKDRVDALQNGFHVPFSFNRDCLAQSSSSVISVLMENLDTTSVITDCELNKLRSEDSKDVDKVEPSNNKFSTTNQVMPLCTVQDALQESGKDQPDILRGAGQNGIGVRSGGFIEASTPLNQSLNANMLEMMKSDLSRLSCQEEESKAFSQCDDYNVGMFGEFSNGLMNSYFNGDMMEQFYGDKDAIDTDHTGLSSFFSFPIDCELHKALGPALWGQTNECPWDSSGTGDDACNLSSLICNRDLIGCIEPSAWESSGWSAKGADAEHLLEAVVTKVYDSLGDSPSNRSNSVRSSTTSLGQLAASSQAQSQSEKSALSGDDSVPWNHVTSAFVARGRNALTNSSTSASSFKSAMSRVIDEQHQNKDGYMQPRKGAKLSNVSKRRARPVDKQRPRPRDRQMIQDRVKELRELVPNGAKCSIDGLLDQTIQHMLFLKGVTDRAEKLRQWMHQEVAGGISWKTSDMKGASQNGTSWAFQLGSELEVCPIVVEDLEYPGHILIEMLCNEHGFFLEIAQVIRHLELTILKGVMESRSNSTWAHFIVKVSRGFHRMDIFWPLMQLLQRNRKPMSSKI
ncbi:hypothetical protein L1049_007617 [Liquidambar formosana]|uniref:BHLH domain-containing protein n=1 Tax=Liquidambar formosana TaxID=63359 RepID=A0AAP0X4S6_LIQFO